ncbi:hypothetical protein KUCAC02_021122 [Chaenocephalus aceratus]|uniref:Uncharacterized protein n=1 Tax=Chaenocephalus aceratus TaxID=36190 RepID=A0ACB9XGQ1_CHAAC|nr:hypothetical protein KUCAC02_021122 [Chaenocephalus aceratus]
MASHASRPDRGGQRQGFLKKTRRTSGSPGQIRCGVDQDWTSVYPTATPFRPSSVPLPIPNFLHLTPVAIRKHCEALKSFCTAWPSALGTDAQCDEHFPVKVESTDYMSAAPSLRNPSARVVHLRVKLSSLNLDDHARKKMLNLVETDTAKTPISSPSQLSAAH